MCQPLSPYPDSQDLDELKQSYRQARPSVGINLPTSREHLFDLESSTQKAGLISHDTVKGIGLASLSV